MPEQPRESPTPLPLPENPNLDWLRKQAKRQLEQLRIANPKAKLAEAQLEIARQYGFSSWRALKAHVDSLTIDGQLVNAARRGELDTLTSLLDRYPEKLHLRIPPYEWTLLHTAAHNGQLAAVDLLLKRGLDVNTREKGDNTYAMHWAAAAGHLDVVIRLADAGGDIVGRGDDHNLEVIGWAVCWEGCDDAAHNAVAEFLMRRGARHHIFSAIAANLADEVRSIITGDPSALSRRMSRNENHQTPLQYAVHRKRAAIVALLLQLGADPLAVDGSGFPVAAYATEPDIDRPVMERIHSMLLSEIDSSIRGHRDARLQTIDLVAALALGDWELAARLLRKNPDLLNHGLFNPGLFNHGLLNHGALHLMAKRNHIPAAGWLLEHGADPNGRWAHWDSDVTPLHLAVLGNHPEMVRLLLAAGADPAIRDTKHNSDAAGWADFLHRGEILRMLRAAGKS